MNVILEQILPTNLIRAAAFDRYNQAQGESIFWADFITALGIMTEGDATRNILRVLLLKMTW